MLAVLEAVLGQLYLITVVALVVQNLGQARRKKQPRVELVAPARPATGTRQRGHDAATPEPGASRSGRRPSERLPRKITAMATTTTPASSSLRCPRSLMRSHRASGRGRRRRAVQTQREHVEHGREQCVVGLLDQLADHLVLRQPPVTIEIVITVTMIVDTMTAMKRGTG